MGNLRNSAKLTKGKAIGAQVNLADTFNEIVDVLNRLEVDTPLKLDKLPFGKWIIGLESSQGSGTGDMPLDNVSIHKRTLTGEEPQPVQLLNFDSPSGTTMPEPSEPADGATPLDEMDDFQLIVRRVNPSTSEASLAYIDKSGLAAILGAREETVLTIARTDDDTYTLTARKVLAFSSDANDPAISLTLGKKRIVSGVEWDSPDLKEKAFTALVIKATDASGSDTASGADTTIATFVPHSSL